MHNHEEHGHGGRGRGREGFPPPPFARGFRGGPGMGPRGQWGRGGAYFGGGPKAARGDVKAAILNLLAEQPMHGYQVIQEIDQRTDGGWRLSPGSVYPTLQALEDQGLITADVVEGKRIFSLTEAGREQLAEGSGGPLPWEQFMTGDDRANSNLPGTIKELVGAVVQIFHSGSPEQLEKAKAVLDDTKKKLYLILANVDEN
ncbi:MAG: PadR family transcriptional regulator [Acidimicrobiaceae bacterium]|nr:PadR family transcriptional regulator [Acidimicrobiaceae bacterium]